MLAKLSEGTMLPYVDEALKLTLATQVLQTIVVTDSQHTVNTQSTRSQHTVNTQSTSVAFLSKSLYINTIFTRSGALKLLIYNLYFESWSLKPFFWCVLYVFSYETQIILGVLTVC